MFWFDLIQSDVWGIAPHLTHGSYKCFVTLLMTIVGSPEFICYIQNLLSLLPSKSSLHMLRNNFQNVLKYCGQIRGWGEYLPTAFQLFLQEKGIVSQRTSLYTLQQNRVAERKNRLLLDVTLTLLLESSVPTCFWHKALTTTVHLINWLPSPSINNESLFLTVQDTTYF